MSATFKKLFLALVTLALGAISSGALAEPIYTASVNGTSYDFTYFTGTYNANTSKFSTTLMPWWGGDQTTAEAFATVVSDNFGYLNTGGTAVADFASPYFAFQTSNPGAGPSVKSAAYLNPDYLDGDPQTQTGDFSLRGETASYVTATVNVVPEPSTYAMALAGLACGGYSMFRRRKRA
jgi:hypothetical protein